MDTISLFLVLGAALLHAVWNAFIKESDDSFLRLGVLYFGNVLIGIAMLPFVAAPDLAVLPYIGVSCLFHAIYFFSLSAAYRDGDLSHVYPIARGLSPVLIVLLAWLLAGETPGFLGLSAVLIICTAILSLAVQGQSDASAKPVWFALLTAASIAGYSTLDGMGVRVSGAPAGFIAWIFIAYGIIPVGATLAMRRKTMIVALRKEFLPGMLGGLLGAVGYAVVVWAMSRNPLGVVSALRETSVIFAAYIGTRILGETGRKRRVIASFGVAVGIILLQSSSAY